jgi:hypothetical protein
LSSTRVEIFLRRVVDPAVDRSSSGQSAGLALEQPWPTRTNEASVMNTLLITSQIVCYGVGIVSASLNIASFMRLRRNRLRRSIGQAQRTRPTSVR